MKKEIKAQFIDTTLKIGEPAHIIVDGRWMKTSPVVKYFVGCGFATIETEHTVYTTRKN